MSVKSNMFCDLALYNVSTTGVFTLKYAAV